MKRKLILSAASLLALAGCGTPEGTEEAAADMQDAATNVAADTGAAIENTTAAAAGAVTPAADANTAAGYAMNAAMSDMYEIQSSQLALQKSQSRAVKDFAQMMIKDHTDTTNRLKSTLQQAGVTMTLPTTLDQRHQEMLTELQNASGADFDTRYLDQQTRAHRQAVDLHRGYAENGENPQLQQLATSIAPAVQQHFERVQQLDSSDPTGGRTN